MSKLLLYLDMFSGFYLLVFAVDVDASFVFFAIILRICLYGSSAELFTLRHLRSFRRIQL